MSLINQMLKDLEARRLQQGGVLQQKLLTDVQAVAEEEQRPGRILFITGLMLVLLSGLGWWGYRALQPTPAFSYAVAPVLRQPAEAPKMVAVTPPVTSVTSSPSLPAVVPAVVPAVPVVPVAVRSEEIDVKILPIVTEVATPTIAEPTAVVAVTKVERPLSPPEQAEAAFQRALTAQKAGERAKMEAELRQALEDDPAHFLARETLSAQLYRAGRLDEAKVVLRGGMTGTSAPVPLRKTLARILVDQGDPEGAALVLLQGGGPAVAEDTEFHQLLAAIYQRTGQFSAATQTYRQLLTVQRKNGVWWLGLGLALESERLLSEAKIAYRSALEDPALQPKLGDYVRSRLSALVAVNGG